MEAFEDTQPGKFTYDIVGHSGESPSVPFVREGLPPTNNNERLKVLQSMYAHSQYCTATDDIGLGRAARVSLRYTPPHTRRVTCAS